MKLIALFLTLVSLNSFAADSCKGKAVRGAMALYNQTAGGIQGDAPAPSHDYISSNGEFTTHAVNVFGQNDEGESWTAKFVVVTRQQGSVCKVLSVKEIEVINH